MAGVGGLWAACLREHTRVGLEGRLGGGHATAIPATQKR